MVKPKVGIFVRHPYCSMQSCNGVIAALSESCSLSLFSTAPMEDSYFSKLDLVIFPGGFGHSDAFDFLLTHNSNAIREYVSKSGRYLGICLGAYWASSHYFDILDSVSVTQYIKSPTSCTLRPHAKDMKVLWNSVPKTMFFYDGPTFSGEGNYSTISTYPNSDPMAIIQGRIGLIGCHPEAQEFWYSSYSYLSSKFIDRSSELRSFTFDLLKNT